MLALALSTLASTARGQVRADMRAGLYHDSDNTTIGTATAAVRGTIEDRVTLKARYLADIISSASVDVVSAATPSFFEVRHEAEGGVSYFDGTTTANGTYIYSIENDWDSHTGAVGFGQDILDHQVTLGLGGSFVVNNVGREDDDNFADKLYIGSGTASVAVVASKNDLVSMAYTFTYAAGYQASPYRFAYLADPTGLTIGLPETHPEGRLRHALAVRHNHYLFKNSSFRSHGRAYIDDWGVKSMTVGAELIVGFLPLELGLRARGYLQSAATFYESVYEQRRRFMTADRELGAFFDVFGGGKIGVRHDVRGVIETFDAELRADAFYFRFFDFPRLTDRVGLTAELAVGATF